MATKNIGIRVEEESADRFTEIKGSFVNAAEFANWIMQAFDKEQTAKSADVFKSEIQTASETVNSLLLSFRRISELAATTCQNKDIQIQSILEGKDSVIQELKADLDDVATEKAKLEAEKEELITAKDAEIKEHKDTAKALASELEETKKLLEKANADIDTLRRLTNEYDKNKAKYESFETKNAELTKSVSSLEKQLVEAKTTVDEQNKALVEAKRQNASLVSDHTKELAIASKEKDLAVAQARAEETTKSQEALKEQLKIEEKALRDCSHLKDTIAKLEKEKHALVASHATEIQALQKEIEKLKTSKESK